MFSTVLRENEKEPVSDNVVRENEHIKRSERLGAYRSSLLQIEIVKKAPFPTSA